MYTIFCFNNNFTVTSFDIAHHYYTINFRNNSRVAGVSCFKQFSNTGKTAGNISQLTKNTGNLHYHLSGSYFFTFFHYDMASGRQVI